MKIYGGFLLEAVVAVLLLVLLFSELTDTDGNSGIIRIIGANITLKPADYSNYSDFASYVEDSGRKPPVITYTGGSQISVGEDCLREWFYAQDDAGIELPVTIISVTDLFGTEILCDDAGKMVFAQAGIYRVKVTAVDGRNKRTTNVINIPVNE